MILQDVFEQFVKQSPVSVMVRATLENVFSQERVDDLFAGVGQQRLFLAVPVGIVAALALALVMPPDGLAVAVLDAVHQRGADLLAAIGELRIARDHAEQRSLIGAQRIGQQRRQLVIDSKAQRQAQIA